MEVILGIDIGGSTTKIVGLRTDGSVVSMLRVRAEDQVTSLYGALGNYLTSNGLSLGDVRRVVLTGVGASYVDGDVFGLPTCRVDEFQASGTGALALSGQTSGVVVTMGTGTAFLWAEAGKEVRHLCGSGIGGGTLMMWNIVAGLIYPKTTLSSMRICHIVSVNLCGPVLIIWENLLLIIRTGQVILLCSGLSTWRDCQKTVIICIAATGIRKRRHCIFYLTGTGKAVKER